MRFATRIWMRVKMLFGRDKAGARLDAELRDHLERQTAENLAAGMSADEARFAALREFGNPALVREQARAAWSWNWLELLAGDVRYGVRTLARTPEFALTAMVVMALGIGANVALFTIVHAVLLKPLPFRDPDRLVRLYEQTADGKSPYNISAPGVFAEWKKQSKTFSELAISSYAGYSLSGQGEQLPETVRAATFSWNMLPTLGVEPALGRNFTAEDDRPGANPTVLLSWGLWKRRFGGDAGIVNQTILLDAKPYTVVGVLPAWFGYPDPGIQLWTPVYLKETPSSMAALDEHNFMVIGRLRPGVTEAEGVAELTLITRRLHDAHRDLAFVSIAANGRMLLDSMVRNVKTPLYVLLAATGCVLLIACLNVANLLVARGATRRKELAVRTALGASWLRLLRQHLMESVLLSTAGGAVGLGLAYGAVEWFVRTRQDMARVEAIHMDGGVAAFTAGLVALCALFAGLISSLTSRSNDVLPSLQESSRANSAGSGRARLRMILLSVEVGLTVVLLVGAGLLLKSYEKLRSTDVGCITTNVMKMDLSLPAARYGRPGQVTNFYEALLSRVRSLPGIRAAGLVNPVVPGDGWGGDQGFAIVEHPALPPGQMPDATNRWVDPGYFAAIGIPIVRGHTFDGIQKPDGPSQVLISEELARQQFPGEDPLGKHLRPHFGDRLYEIVGVVGDTMTSPGNPVRPMMMYFPELGLDDARWVTLVVRSDRNVMAQAIPVQQIVAGLDRDLPVSDVLTMDQVLGKNMLDQSFDATLLAAFAGLSLLLAAVGLFGVLSYLVAQRRSEIGIRIALGAPREQVLRKMLLDGLRPALLGLLLGLAASVAVVRQVQSMLFGTEPLDPAVFVAVSATLLLVAALACLVPAWRASRLDPMQALRTE
jgi:putative ABC transport system permease protein